MAFICKKSVRGYFENQLKEQNEKANFRKTRVVASFQFFLILVEFSSFVSRLA